MATRDGIPEYQAPPLRRLLREAIDFPRILVAPLLPVVPTGVTGRGQPVLVIPGFTDSDNGISRLVRSLNSAGFAATGWEQGFNMGLRPGLMDGLAAKLEATAEQADQKVVMLGWSLGGLYAREVAKLRPDLVRLVMTLGSPFSGSPRNNNAWRLYEALNDHSVDNPPIKSNLAEKPPVPTFAVWSPIDGVVAPGAARGLEGEADEAIELRSSHMGLGSKSGSIRRIVRLLADRL